MKITILKVGYNETASEFTRVEAKMTGLTEEDRILIGRMVDEVLSPIDEGYSHLKSIKGTEYYLVLNQDLFIASIAKLKEYGISLQVKFKSDYINLAYVSLGSVGFNGVYNVIQNKVEGLPMWGTIKAQKFFKDLAPFTVPYFSIQLVNMDIDEEGGYRGAYLRFSGDTDKLIDVLLDKCKLSEDSVSDFEFIDDNTVIHYFDMETLNKTLNYLKGAGVKLKFSVLSDCLGIEYTAPDNSAYFGFYNVISGEVEEIPVELQNKGIKNSIKELSEFFPLAPQVSAEKVFPFPRIHSSSID